MAGLYLEVEFYDHDGGWLGVYRPTDLRWSYKLANTGDIGDISGNVSLRNEFLTADQFAALAADWLLNIRVGDTGVPVDSWDRFPLSAGIVTSANLVSESQVVAFAGKDWLHYLEQPYPFLTGDGTSYYENTLAENIADAGWSDSGWSKRWSSADGATQQDVCEELINSLTDLEYDIIAPYITAVFNGTAWGEEIDYMIAFQDETTVLDHLRAIGEMGTPKGFDFWVDWDGTLRLEGPRLVEPSAAVPRYSLTSALDIISIDWTNDGPLETETVGFGDGSGNTRGYFQDTYQPSQDAYRRWKRMINFSSTATDFSGDNMIEERTSAVAFQDRFPQKQLKLVVKPRTLDPLDPAAGFFPIIGETIDVDYTFDPYHRIDAVFYVTAQDYTSDNAGNWRLEYTLDQIFD